MKLKASLNFSHIIALSIYLWLHFMDIVRIIALLVFGLAEIFYFMINVIAGFFASTKIYPEAVERSPLAKF